MEKNIKEGEYWFVWMKDQDENHILSGTISPNKDFVEKRLNFLREKKPKLEFGIGYSKVHFSDITYIKEKESSIFESLECSKFVIVDCETTGSSKKDEVIDLAAVIVQNYEIIGEFQSFIKNTVPITFHSQKVHGISESYLEIHGREAKEVFEEFKHFVGNLKVVGHGVSYDKRMIEQHSAKVGVPVSIDILYDTNKIARKMLDMPNSKLSDILDRFSLRENLKSHGALDDVIGTQRLAKKMYKIYKS